jgi:hypothetical protein
MTPVRLAQMLLAGPTPPKPMPHNPVGQCVFETDIVTGLLGFQPFMAENFLTFRLKLSIKRRAFHQLGSTRKPGFIARHKRLITS